MSDLPKAGWTAERRALAWLNIALQAILLLAFLVVVNMIAMQGPKRIDLTSRHTYRLSNPSEDVLKNLSYDLEIWINSSLYEQADDKSLSMAVMRTDDLLEEMIRRTKRITVKRLNTEDKADFARFRQHWTTISPATIYILATLGTGRTNTKIIEIQQIYEGDTVTGEIKSYRGESALIGAFRELAGGVKRVVYESEGHQEFLSIDKSQMAVLRHFLTTNEGVDLKRLSLIDYKSVPEDCELLMILGPAQPFQQHELDVIRDYLDRGGSVLIAVRPRVRTGLEKLLENYSVAVGDNIVFDPQQYVPPTQTKLVVRDFNLHEVNRNMVNLGFVMPDSCTVDPIPRKDIYWKITPLAMAGPKSWEEKGELGPTRTMRPTPDERQGNMKLITVVERKFKEADRKKMKLDVWGSVSPFTDGVLYANRTVLEVQIQYVINHFRWLLDREVMDIKPERIPITPLLLNDDQLTRLFWIVMTGFPAFGVVLGILAWFVRRK